MADPKHGVRQTLSRVAVVVAVLASALVVLPGAVTPAGAAFDQGSSLPCSEDNYPAGRNGDIFRQTFTPTRALLTTVQVCATIAPLDPGQTVDITIGINTVNGLDERRSIHSQTKPFSAEGTILRDITISGPVILTPGVTYELAVDVPFQVSLRGTNAGTDVYPRGSAVDEGIGDFGFNTFSDDVPGLENVRPEFDAATTDLRLVEETFDFYPDGTPISEDIPGVSLFTAGDYALSTLSPVDGDSVLFAEPQTEFPVDNFTYEASFDERARAVGFLIEDLSPAAGPVTVELSLSDGDTTADRSFQIHDDDNDEGTPTWFGFRDPSLDVTNFRVVGPASGDPESTFPEAFSIDELTFERRIPEAIAFSRNSGIVEDDNELFVVEADGSNPTAITDNDGVHDADPHWSPDGSMIAFVSDRAGDFDIWVMESDGTEPRNLTAGIPFAADPTWAPGNRIAFVSDNPAGGFIERLDVFVVDPDGQNLQVVVNDSAGPFVRDAFPTFDPSGERLFFGRGLESSAEHHLYAVGLPGTDQPLVQITNFAGNQIHPAASPVDADEVAYVQESTSANADGELYVIDGETVTRLTHNGFREASPAWSPDGTHVVFMRDMLSDEQLVKRNVATGVETVLTSGAFDGGPSWNPGADDGVDGITLEADRSTAQVGVAEVDLQDIPAEYLALIASGEQAARLESAPAGSIPAGSIPAGSIPAGSIPAGSIPAGSIPAGSIDLEASPAGSIPVYSLFLDSLPAGSIPAGSIPAGSIPAGSIGLNGTLLSALGLTDAETEALLVGSDLEALPRQTITLRQLLSDPVVEPRFLQLDLADSGLGRSLFGSVGMAALLLGAHPINDIPVPAGASANPNATWCDVLLEQTGRTCAELGIDPNEHSFIGAQLAGAGIASLPAGSIPAGSIPAGSIALWSLPAGSIAVEGTPAGSIPAGSIAHQSAPAGSIPAGSILVEDAGLPSASPAGSIPAGSIPAGSIFAKTAPAGSIPAGSIATETSRIGQIAVRLVALEGTPAGSIAHESIPAGSIPQVLTCGGGQAQPCPQGMTLARANVLGFLRPDAKLWMLGSTALAGVTVGDVINGLDPNLTLLDLTAAELNAIKLWMIRDLLDQYGVTLAELERVGALEGITLGDLPPAAFADVRLYEIILQILILTDYPWEQLPLDGMQDFAAVPDNEVGYTATGDVQCPAGETATFDLDLGEFRYLGGTGRIAMDGGDGVPVAPVAIPGGLRWTVPGGCDDERHDVVLTFDAIPGLRIGPNVSDLTVTAGSEVRTIEDQAEVLVLENGEPDGTTARTGTPDRLIVGHLSGPDDVDTITIPMPEKGSRVRVYLSHVPEGADYDLAISTPPNPGGPIQSSPAGSIPAGSIPLEDGGRGVDGAGALQNETLQDVPAGSIPAGSISANRGSEDEVAQVISNGASGMASIRITGYLESWDPRPYLVRVKVFDPIVLDCVPRSGITPPTGAPTELPVPAPAAGTESLFLLNVDRMRDLYGAADVSAMITKLRTIAGRPEVQGQIVPVEGFAGVRTAFTEWDQRPCDIDAANAVVQSVNDVIEDYRAAAPTTLRNVVLLGTDELLPFARVPDLVTLSNEQDQVADLAFTLTPDGKANALYASAALGYVLTNDAYTSFTEVPWLDRQLHLPEIAASRLIETPADISGQLDEYLRQNGVIDVGTATTFVTGYDFLTDGSLDIAENTERVVPRTAGDPNGEPTGTQTSRTRRLINDAWGKTDLTNVLLNPTVPAPTINSLNAHFSHNLLQPAGPTSGAGGAGFTRTDLLSAGEIPAPTTDPAGAFTSTLLGRLLFSMGCHGGLNVPDNLAPSAPESLDWAQKSAEQRAAVFIANTGYGYGDTVANALSERLLTIFSRHLADPSTTLAEKLVLAKHEYFSTMGTYGVFDEKVLIEMSYYGLPFWRIGPAVPAADPVVPDVEPGSRVPVAIDPVAEGVSRIEGPRGTFWATGPDRDVAFSPYRPLQPLITKSVTADEVATGVLLKGLATTDVEVTDFARALPTIDLAANEPEPTANNDIYPANLVRLSTSKPFGELDQKLVVIAGQSRGDDVGPGGIERLVSSLDVDVLYGGNTPRPDVVIEEVSGRFTPGPDGGTASFLGRANTEVDEAYVLYRVVTTGTSEWSLAELDLQPDGTWTTDVQIATTEAEPVIEMLAQFVKDDHVFYSTNKGFFFNALPEDVDPPAIEVLTPSANQELALGQVVTADYECIDPNLVSCEGATADGSVLDTTRPGPRVFTVEAVDRTGNRRTLDVPYSVAGPTGDTRGPSISITAPSAIVYPRGASVLADYACSDPSGVASCAGPVADGAPVDTSTLGSKTFTVTAEDELGTVSSRSVTYSVVDGTAPTISITSPADGATFGVGQVVSAEYDCADEAGGSGLAGCSGSVADGAPIDTTTPGAKLFTVHALDNAGNSASKTVTYTVADQQAPSITITTPAEGASYGRGQVVVADYSCTDASSAVTSCVGTVADGAAVDTASLGGKTFTVTARDAAGNESTKTVSYTVRDVTAPTITITTPVDGATYKRGASYSALYTCSDEAGGSGISTCIDSQMAGNGPIDTATLGTKTFTVHAFDNAGNASSKTVTYHVTDQTDPVANISSPSEGAVYKLNQVVTASYGCTDEAGGSGLASCTGTVANGLPVDTSSVGTKSFTVTARDNAGNVGTKTVQYKVEYVFTGWFSPIDNGVLNRMQAGAAVPVKFRLADVNGVVVTSLSAVKQPITSVGITCPASDPVDDVEQTVAASTSGLQYDATNRQFQYNWKTDKTNAGKCRRLTVELLDGTRHTADFQFKK
jgi:Tol biopolymer transport system component/fibronectin type 3 domain-containing protein